MSLRSILKHIKTFLVPNRRKKRRLELKHRILVGTHHKAGTVWLGNVFRRICEQYGLTFYEGMAEKLPQEFDVFFRGDSQLQAGQIRTPFKGVHMIRDPRDIIVSGCFYHQKAREKWLHIKQDRYGGLTYQEKIKSYQSLDDQILFEMENGGYHCIQEILAWNYDDPAFYEVKYEDLILDEQLILFHNLFAFLGFPGKAIPRVLKIAFNYSLFSGTLKNELHIRSGKTRQWEKHFSSHHKVRFLGLFGEALQRLGYENSDAWAADPRADHVRELRRAA